MTSEQHTFAGEHEPRRLPGTEYGINLPNCFPRFDYAHFRHSCKISPIAKGLSITLCVCVHYSVCVCPLLCVCVCPLLCVCVCVCPLLCVCVSITLCVYVSITLCVYVSITLCVCVHYSVCVCVRYFRSHRS